MSAEAYQEWDYVLGQAGVDITSMTTGLKTMTNQIDDAKNGSVKAQERFAKLGISLNDLNTMSREDIFASVQRNDRINRETETGGSRTWLCHVR